MPKYSIFINRFKCLDDTTGVGKDEISFAKFSLYFRDYKNPIMNIEHHRGGSFDTGHSIWLPDSKKYLHEKRDIPDIDYTLFYVLLIEDDDTPDALYDYADIAFRDWFKNKLVYYRNTYDTGWNHPDRWRQKLISATYAGVRNYFYRAADNPVINDDEMIDVRRVIIYKENLDTALSGKRVEKNYTFTGAGGKYRMEIFIYGVR